MKRTEKLIAMLIAVVVFTIALSGCGNMSMGLGSFTFEHIHFTDMNEGHCATVEKWYDNEGGIEVKTKEHGPMFLSEGSYIMFGKGEQCPYCE